MGRLAIGVHLAVFIALLCGAHSVAGAVVGNPGGVSVEVGVGQDFEFPLVLNSDSSVAGIGGDLCYNPERFADPKVFIGPGALDRVGVDGRHFVLVSHVMEPGRLRFALYSNPLADVDLGASVLRFRLHVKETVEAPVSDILAFSSPSAAGTGWANLGVSSFGTVTVDVVAARTKARGSWMLYE